MPPPKPYRRWNDLAAYQFDQAVLFVGTVIENAANEREEVGPKDAREWRNKYTLAQLLDPAFRLPVKSPQQPVQGIKQIAAANPGIVGRWKQAAQNGETVK